MTVTALLVSHDGARWLPAVLDGLSAQTRRPDRTLAVDTGSTDATRRLLTEALGDEAVLDLPARTSWPEAVSRGLERLPSVGSQEWVWLLHDDSRPAPDALEQLLAAADAHPTASIVGAKLREWPSLRRLLEVGVTMTGTGRRESGLEAGEYDQGQHDRVRDVLAVSSAGMLVRRDVLEELGGFDRRLPVFGNDLDLGWRAARAGHRTIVAPDAVVFHVEAAHRGVRRTPLTGRPRRAERRAALYTLLVNCSLVALPFVTLRLLGGSLLRALGLLLVRAPGEALDELSGLALAYLRPDQVVRGRLARRRTTTVPAREVRPLLPPFWLPYRHGLDAVSDLASALLGQASDASARRSARRLAEPGPVAAEAQVLAPDTGLVARLLTSPTAAVLALLVLTAAVAARGVVGAGYLSGGALLPAPASASAWWELYLESWHPTGVGSAFPAAPYLLPLAVAATVLLGKAWLLVDVLFLLAVPLSAWGATRFLARLGVSTWPRLWGGAAYAVVPAVSGALGQGRLGTVAAAVVLPWVAHAALGLVPSGGVDVRGDRDRRWRAAWRTAVLLALLVSFVPLAWPLAVLLAGVAVLPLSRRDRAASLSSTRSLAHVVGPLVVAVGFPLPLLLPWSVQRFTDGGPVPWYSEAGLPAPELIGDLGAWELLAGRATAVDGLVGSGQAAAPALMGLGIALAAVAALARRGTRPVVVAAWVVLVVALGAAVLLDARGAWVGFPVLMAQAAAVTAVTAAGDGITAQLSGRSFGWAQPVGFVVVLAAVLSPVAGLLWWAATGTSGPLERAPAHRLPAYMTDAADRSVASGVLVLRGDAEELTYTLVRGNGVRLGEDTVTASQAAHGGLTGVVGRMATAATPEDVEELSRYGVEFVYAAPPADPVLSGSLDSVSGLSAASAARPHARAWQVDAEPSLSAVRPAGSGTLRAGLLVAQAVAIVVALVLAAPTRKQLR